MKMREYIEQEAYAPSKYTLLLDNGGCGGEFFMECLPEEGINGAGIHFLNRKDDSTNETSDYFVQLNDEELDEFIEHLIKYREYINSEIKIK